MTCFTNYISADLSMDPNVRAADKTPSLITGSAKFHKARAIHASLIRIGGELDVQTSSIATPALVVNGDARFSRFEGSLPKKMNFNSSVLLEHMYKLSTFGCNTHISGDLHIQQCDAIVLHDTLSVGGNISTSGTDTIILFSDKVAKNLQNFEPNAQYACVSDESTLSTVLHDIFGESHVSKTQRRLVAKALRTMHKNGIISFFSQKSYVPYAFASQLTSGKSIHRHLTDTSEKTVTQLLQENAKESNATKLSFSRDLYITDSNIEELPDGLHVEGVLRIENCQKLKQITASISAKKVVIKNCRSLEYIDTPNRMRFLHVRDCESFQFVGPSLALSNLIIKNCPNFSKFALFRNTTCSNFVSDSKVYYNEATFAKNIAGAQTLPVSSEYQQFFSEIGFEERSKTELRKLANAIENIFNDHTERESFFTHLSELQHERFTSPSLSHFIKTYQGETKHVGVEKPVLSFEQLIDRIGSLTTTSEFNELINQLEEPLTFDAALTALLAKPKCRPLHQMVKDLAADSHSTSRHPKISI